MALKKCSLFNGTRYFLLYIWICRKNLSNFYHAPVFDKLHTSTNIYYLFIVQSFATPAQLKAYLAQRED